MLSTFHLASRESCLGLSVVKPEFLLQSPGMKDSEPAKAIAARHAHWKARLPKSDKDLWDALQALDSGEQAALFAHCAAYALNAVSEVVPKYDNGRVSGHMIARRLEHSHVLARAVGLDMVAAGWRPTVDNYLGRVTKPQIIAAVTEAKGAQTAGLIDHLKKGDMAREAERLMTDADWLPEPLRTPVADVGEIADPLDAAEASEPGEAEPQALPAFLNAEEGRPDGEADDPAAPAHVLAAE